MEGFWIVTTDAYDENGLPLVIAEDAVDDTVYINGLFDSVTIYAPGAQVIMDGDDSSVGTMTVTKEAVGSSITLGTGTEIGLLEIGATTEIKGDGTVKNADINANGVVFEKRPVQWQEQDDLDVPPVMPDEPTPTPGGGGGGGMAVSDDPVIAGQLSAVTINTQAPVTGNEMYNGSSTIDHATGPVVTWSADDGANFAAANAGDKFSAPIAYQTKSELK